MVSMVGGLASTMNIRLGMGSDPKAITDRIFAKLDSETMTVLNAPDKAAARSPAIQPADGQNKHPAHGNAQNAVASEKDWQERAEAANSAFALQMQQIRVAQGGSMQSGQGVAMLDPSIAASTDPGRGAVDLHFLLANFAKPEDADGDSRVTSMESLAYTTKLASSRPSPKNHQELVASAPDAVPDHLTGQAAQSYLAMLHTPKMWAANSGAAVDLAA